MHDSHKEALACLDRLIDEPSRGLPDDVFLFISGLTPLVNVDLVITDHFERMLLTWRDDEIDGVGWHIPGGIIRFKETAESRIIETARHELGATVSFDEAPIAIEQFIQTRRRVRGHMISLAYRCRLRGNPDEHRRFCGGTPRVGEWAWHLYCPENLIAAHDRYRRFFKAKPTESCGPHSI